jgi:hypothetical protein
MSVVPTLKLYVDEDQSNYYWMDVTLPTGGTYDTDSHESVPQVNASDEIHIDVNVVSPYTGNVTIQVIIGESNIDYDTGEIHVNLVNSESVSVGNGTVKVKEAEETTRPIPLGGLV